MRSTGDQTRSAAAATMFIGCSVAVTSNGASGAVTVIVDDDPMCRQGTISRSWHAAQNGSQWSECRLGSPSFDGVLRERDRVHAQRGEALELGDGQVDVPERHEPEGDEPARVLPAPRVDVPVVVRLHEDVREFLVLGFGEHLPAQPRERREAQRREHTVGVHVVDARVDVPAARTHLLVRGRIDAVLVRGRPATAFSPMFGNCRPS